MLNLRCAFVNYTPINACKRLLKEKNSRNAKPEVPRFLNVRESNRRVSWLNPYPKVLMVAENKDNETFRALELDIKEYLNNISETLPNPLSYVNLKKKGRIDLVSRVIDAGGYIEVSRRLGIPVDNREFVTPPNISTNGSFAPFLKSEDEGTSIVFGSSLEDRMKSMAESGKGSGISKSITSLSNARTIDTVPSAVELIKQNERIAPPVVDEPLIEGENLSFTILMRLGLLSLTTITAIGFGKASNGVVSPSIINASKSAASGLTFGHLLLALYSALLVAPRMRRNSTLWFIKVLLGGPLAVVELRSLGNSELFKPKRTDSN
ncbi:unnamed protein product [Agarophyton chilense]